MPDWIKDSIETLAHLTGNEGWEDWIRTALGLTGFILALWLVYQEFLRCFLLLRRMHYKTRRGGFWQVAWTIGRLALTDGALLSLDRRTLARRTRILIEHELFNPKPMRDWNAGVPMRQGAFLPARLWVHVRNFYGMWRTYWQDSSAWWAGMHQALSLHGDWTIVVNNPAIVNGRIDEIKCYFDCLHSLGYEGSEGDRFICPIEVTTGFIAPLHLLTGLYGKFDENWGPIIRSFDKDIGAKTYKPDATLDQRLRLIKLLTDLDEKSVEDWTPAIRSLDKDIRAGIYEPDTAIDRDLRQIQLFIYNCWLLWGPSIPICECGNWSAPYSVIQYGFGDENNSIEIVGEKSLIKQALDALMEGQQNLERASRTDGGAGADPQPFLGMAIPANVKGRLRLSGSLGGRVPAEVNALPLAALESWGGQKNERPVLFISEIGSTNAVDGDVESLNHHRGRIASDRTALPSRYYSAYLWVAVVVLLPTARGLVPLGSARPEAPEPWKDFIPFFEHGNLADPESCLFGKRQLASKVVLGLAAALRSWGGERDPLHFAFACAIDESGCDQPLAHPAWNGHVTMRDLIDQALESLAPSDPDVRRLKDEKLLRMNHFSGAPGQHPFSSCHFPDIVSAHYAMMEARDGAVTS